LPAVNSEGERHEPMTPGFDPFGLTERSVSTPLQHQPELSSEAHSPLESHERDEQKGLSFKEAALLILRREGREMTAKEIVTIAFNEGMLNSAGKTPDASLAGQIYTDIHRNKDTSPFVIVAPRTYALKSSPADRAMLEQPSSRPILAGNFPRPNLPIEPEPLPPSAAEIVRVKKMSYKQVALYLLEREKRPMTAREIVAIAIAEGLIESTGKTPDATLAGQLYTDMQRAGERSPIRLIGPRTYAMTDWYKK
jgi:restriction system protein